MFKKIYIVDIKNIKREAGQTRCWPALCPEWRIMTTLLGVFVREFITNLELFCQRSVNITTELFPLDLPFLILETLSHQFLTVKEPK